MIEIDWKGVLKAADEREKALRKELDDLRFALQKIAAGCDDPKGLAEFALANAGFR